MIDPSTAFVFDTCRLGNEYAGFKYIFFSQCMLFISEFFTPHRADLLTKHPG